MWKVVIVELIVLFVIYSYWFNKTEDNYERQRFYKCCLGFTYFVTAFISVLLVNQFGKEILIYTILSMLFSIGSFLSAVNPNLRILYQMILIYSVLLWIVTINFYQSYRNIVVIVDIIIIVAFVGCVKETINNIRYKIDPDKIEEEKAQAKKKKKVFWKIIKIFYKSWRI